MIGRPSLLSRLISFFGPSDVDTIGELKAWLSPSEPHWEYVPMDGPYTLIRCDVSQERMYAYEVFEKFVPAMVAFAVRNLPRPHEMCVVVDRHHQIVIGWEDPDSEGRYGWSGCRLAFDCLGKLDSVVNPTTVAMWEAAAKVRNDIWGPKS